jgi:hypothetical protein
MATILAGTDTSAAADLAVEGAALVEVGRLVVVMDNPVVDQARKIRDGVGSHHVEPAATHADRPHNPSRFGRETGVPASDSPKVKENRLSRVRCRPTVSVAANEPVRAEPAPALPSAGE